MESARLQYPVGKKAHPEPDNEVWTEVTVEANG